MSELDDSSLLTELLRHEGWLRSFALGLVRDASQVDDLVQRTWIAAWQHPPRELSRSWLRRVLTRFAWQDRRRTLADVRQVGPGEVPAVGEGELQLEKQELRSQLARLLLDLREPYRATLLMRYYEGLEPRQIAERTGVPDGTVRWRIKQGLALMRENMDRQHGGDRSRWQWALGGLLGVPSMPSEQVAPKTRRRGLLAAAAAVVVALGGLWVANRSGSEPVLARASEVQTSEEPILAVLSVDEPPDPVPRSASEAEVPSKAVSAVKHLSVRVVSAGRAIEGAELYLVGPDGSLELIEYSDVDGRARLALRPEHFRSLGNSQTRGSAAVRAWAEGLTFSTLHHFTPEHVEDREYELELGWEGVTVFGRVVDREGQAIAGARVSSNREGNLSQVLAGPGYVRTQTPLFATSDGDGAFVLTGLVRVAQRVHVWAPGHALLRVIQSPASMNQDWELVVESARTVGGTVRSASGQPVPGARVTFDPVHFESDFAGPFEPGYDAYRMGFAEVATADAEGRYELGGVPPGAQRLWAFDPLHPARRDQLEIEGPAGEHFVWDPRLEEQSPLTVRVRNADGSPAVGLAVTLSRADREGEVPWRRALDTDLAGEARFYEVLPRSFGVYVQAALRMSVPLASRLDCDATAGIVELQLEPESLLGRIEGACLRNGLPPPSGILLQFIARSKREWIRGSLGADGTFGRELQPGYYQVLAHLPQVGAFSLGEIEVAPGEVAQLGTTSLPGLVRLAVDKAGLAAATHFRLEAEVSLGEGQTQRFPIDSGTWPPADSYLVFPGSYRLRLSSEGIEPREYTVEVSPGAAVTLGPAAAVSAVSTGR